MISSLEPDFYFISSLEHDFLQKNDRKWPKMPKSDKTAENGLFYVLRSRQHLKIPKSDKTAENGLFYVLRSRQHLKIPKSDKMAKNSLFLRFTMPPTPENTESW